MKQALTETLAYFDENDQAFRMSDLRIYVAAARLVERLLPGECEECGGSGEALASELEGLGCLVCHGSGRVWDEGIVEAVARKLFDEVYREWSEWHQQDRLFQERIRGHARAVLSVLVELLTEKVET